MAERIKGFSIELSLDSMKVDSGLKDLRSSMRLMNSEMRSNMSQFDYGEKSLKKYGVQLDGLKKKYEAQKIVVESARKEYEKMAEKYGENSRQAQNAAAKYNQEAASLNNLERHIGSVTKEMEAFRREQEIQSSAIFKTGDALEAFGDGLGKISSQARDWGRTLTRRITMPVLGVISAAGGITAAFGWKRLVGLDSAQAQLKGLGYNTEEVGRISDQVTTAIEGGMTTMAEGTEVAAGAMAAGVKEGKDLERYIKLVGDAAVGSNRPVGEMAQIFNRVQGSGKLMTQELNMIEMGMPGFAQAMADSLGVPQDEFRKMVTAGEISSKEFMDVMDDFAGGMAEAYADSWQGMVANTKAYIGIIGENLLGGVFEKSKESIREFIDIISSESVQEKAAEIGENVGEAFSGMVDKVKDAIKWFRDLDEGQQKLILKAGAFVVALGPLLTGLGLFGGFVAKISSGLGKFFKVLAPIFVPLKNVGAAAGGAGKSVGILGRVIGGLTNPIGIAITIITAIVTAFTLAYKNSETFREGIKKLGSRIKDVFFKIVDWMTPGLDAIKDFFSEIKEKFNVFSQEDGPQLSEAFKKMIDIAISMWDKLEAVIDFLMPYIESFIKQTWSGIKDIITGALDIILGAAKVFSGVFTGDWSKMWEGVLQIGKGLMKIIWGFIKTSFFGRIITAAIEFAKGFIERIRNMWNGIKNAFTTFIVNIYNGFKASFIGRIISSVIDFALNFRERISKMWSSLKNTFTSYITNIRNSIANSFVGRMISSVTTLKDRFIGLAKDMWGGVRNQFNNIVKGAKGLPKRIGDGIRNAKDKAISGMKSVGNSLIKWAYTPFNKVIGGVNKITGKLGAGKTIDPLTVPQLYKGTKNHEGGPAIVGDKFGRELIRFPNGKITISPDTDTLMDLPKGTEVVPNRLTEKLLKSDVPHYANGTGGPISDIVGGVGKALGKGAKKTKDVLSDVWQYASNPGKLLDLVMSKISITKSLAEIPRTVAGAGLDYVKGLPLEFIKKAFSESGGGGKPAFGWPVTSPFGYRVHPITGARKLHGGTDFGAPMGSPVPSTTGGTVSYAGGGWNGGFGNLVKVRQGMWEMFYAHLSSILVRAGQSIKKGDILGRVGSTGASTGPHLHYETRKNGARVNPMSLKGFKTGGVIKSQMMAMLGEEGEEIVIPTAKNRRTDAMKLLALAAKKIGADGGSYSRPGSIGSGGNDGFKELLKATVEQNEYLREMVELLMKLLDKDLEAVLAFEPVYTAIKKRMNQDNYSRHKQKRGR